MTTSIPSGDVATPRVLPVTAAPANLPVMVRLTLVRFIVATRKRELIPILLIVLPMFVVGLILAVAPPTPEDRKNGVIIVLFGLGFMAYLPISGRRQLGDGFAVGADHTGVYLRPDMDRRRIVFVPWAGVESVSAKKWRGPQLVVKPRDTIIEGQFDLEIKGRWENRLNAEISQHRRVKKLGTNIHAPIPGVDAAELLNNLRYQAAGRAPVEMR